MNFARVGGHWVSSSLASPTGMPKCLAVLVTTTVCQAGDASALRLLIAKSSARNLIGMRKVLRMFSPKWFARAARAEIASNGDTAAQRLPTTSAGSSAKAKVKICAVCVNLHQHCMKYNRTYRAGCRAPLADTRVDREAGVHGPVDEDVGVCFLERVEETRDTWMCPAKYPKGLPDDEKGD